MINYHQIKVHISVRNLLFSKNEFFVFFFLKDNDECSSDESTTSQKELIFPD